MNAIDDWDGLRLFLAIGRAGTLGGAARLLDVETSTVLRRLRRLERQLGTRLLERRGRGSVPTATGERLLSFAERIEEEFLGLERELAGRDAEVRGTVRLTTPDTFAVTVLPKHLATLRERHAALQLELLVDNRFFRLGRGEADVALRPGPKPVEPDVIAKRIGTFGGALYAAPSYLERKGAPRRRADLARHDFVSLDAALSHTPFATLTERVADPLRIVFRASTLLAATVAVESGLGIAALPTFLAERNDILKRLFRREDELESPLWIVFHRDHRKTARIRAIVEHLEESFEEEPFFRPRKT